MRFKLSLLVEATRTSTAAFLYTISTESDDFGPKSVKTLIYVFLSFVGYVFVP